MGYNGDYLEGLVFQAKKGMNNKKYKSFNLSLLQAQELSSLKEVIEEACKKLKELDFHRYKTARKYCNNTVSSKLDHFLAIDDILYNEERNITVGIDWTVNPKDIQHKIEKHRKLQEALGLVVDTTCVVCVSYEDTLDNLDEASLAKAVYKMLKLIDKAVSKSNFPGYLIIDARDLK
jgi:hypothetical protein